MKPALAQKVSPLAFEERYSRTSDPWQFLTSAYEQSRYETTLRALARERYGSAYEPGCSVGAFTLKLARIADQVIATDVAPSAVRRAKRRCVPWRNVTIRCEDVSRYLPPSPLELCVFAEIGYYFEPEALARIATSISNRLGKNAEFIAVHWLGSSEDHVLHGDAVHGILQSSLPLQWISGERHEHFRLDSWRKL